MALNSVSLTSVLSERSWLVCPHCGISDHLKIESAVIKSRRGVFIVFRCLVCDDCFSCSFIEDVQGIFVEMNLD